MNGNWKRGGVWFVTGTLAALTVSFGVNGITMLLHPGSSVGDMRGYIVGATLCGLVAHYLYGRLRETSPNRIAAAQAQASLGAGAYQPSFTAPGTSADPIAVRAERDCPYCAERILAAAKLCKHCHSDVSATAL